MEKTQAQLQDLLLDDAAQFLADHIRDFVATCPQNRQEDGSPFFEEPLIGFASGDDPLFEQYKKLIGPFHLTPQELLPGARALTVVCWALPIAKKTRLANRREKEHPARPWAQTRDSGEKFNDHLRDEVAGLLSWLGVPAVAPLRSSIYHTVNMDTSPASVWSERHALYAAGLGTFSLTDALITAKGMAHRCGSVVAALEIEPTPRKYQGPYENCPYMKDGSCGVCIERCPCGAITPQGHNKLQCRQYLTELRKAWAPVWGITTETGCGLCQTAVPCEGRVPLGRGSYGQDHKAE